MMHAIGARFALPLLAGSALQKCIIIVQCTKARTAVLLLPLNCYCQHFYFLNNMWVDSWLDAPTDLFACKSISCQQFAELTQKQLAVL